MLLEREDELNRLCELLRGATLGNGSTVVISGEAGIGKTSLTRTFLHDAGPKVRILRGACEDFSIAEPLAPLRDLAREADWEMPRGISSRGDRTAVFSEALEILTDSDKTTIVLVEDLHWADDATLDFLRFLARRIVDRPVLLLLTARDEYQEGRRHIRRIVGSLSSDSVTRLELAPLSIAAVTALSKEAARNGDTVYKLAGGNAFYVTELLRSTDNKLPLTVQDSVLSRADALSPEARNFLDAVSIFPRQAEKHLVDTLQPNAVAFVGECFELGLLEENGDNFFFRHELARQAIEGELSGHKRRLLNAALLSCLIAQGSTQHARLLHHAITAGETDAIRSIAPQAAKDAQRLGALRETANYLKLAVETADPLGDCDHATLRQDYAWASYQIGHIDVAIRQQEDALAYFVSAQDITREGDSYRRLSRFHWVAGNRRKASDFARKAIQTLANHRGPELAMAQSTVAQLAMLNNDYAAVAAPSISAMQLAEEFDRPDILSHSLNNLGMSYVWSDPDQARQLLARSLDTALHVKSYDDASRAYTNYAYLELYRQNYRKSIEIATKGIAFCRETDQDAMAAYKNGTIAWALIQLGQFDDALALVGHSFSSEARQDFAKHQMFADAVSVTWLSLRRGDVLASEARDYLEAIIANNDELQRLSVYAEILAERAWLGLGDRDQAIKVLTDVITRAEDICCVPFVAMWLHKLEPEYALPASNHLLKPVQLQIAGQWCEAAKAWAEKGNPFFEALALCDGNTEAQHRAVELLRDIGAKETIKAVQRDMHEDGVAPAPRGPRQSTLSNPAGLTKRQMDVLRELNEGHTNTEIAERLFVSPKTVDHHVSAILLKLDARSRGEAAAMAREAGWI